LSKGATQNGPEEAHKPVPAIPQAWEDARSHLAALQDHRSDDKVQEMLSVHVDLDLGWF